MWLVEDSASEVDDEHQPAVATRALGLVGPAHHAATSPARSRSSETVYTFSFTVDWFQTVQLMAPTKTPAKAAA